MNIIAPEPKNDSERSIQSQVKKLEQSITQSSVRFTLVGEVQRGYMTRYSINGEDFDVDKNTKMQGEFKYGSYATVSGPFVSGQKKVADLVVARKPELIHHSSEAVENLEDAPSGPVETLR